MDNEPLGAGRRIHSLAAAKREEMASERGDADAMDELDGIMFKSAPGTLDFGKPELDPEPVKAPAVAIPLEVNEATEIAANALISLHCQFCPGEPDMRLTGSVRIAIYEMAKTLTGNAPDFSAAANLLSAFSSSSDRGNQTPL